MPDHLTLSRRLLAAGCPWRVEFQPWLTGTHTQDGTRKYRDDNGILWVLVDRNQMHLPESWLPDMDDPLTVCAAWLALEERVRRPIRWLHRRRVGDDGAIVAWLAWLDYGEGGTVARETWAQSRAEAVVLAWEGVTRER